MLIKRLEIILFVVIIFLNQCKRFYCQPDIRCKTVPNLTRTQLDLCYRLSDVTFAAVEGLELAVQECQYQFRWNRWNCSALAKRSRNPHSSTFFKRGYRESAFGHAIASAGVVHSVARACSQGKLLSCGCDPNSSRSGLTKSLRATLKTRRNIVNKAAAAADGDDDHESDNGNKHDRAYEINTNEVVSKQNTGWKWAGCSHNINFGIEFSELFLDSRESIGDFQSQINLHNNRVGRLVVVKNLVNSCKCHGLSGSCQLKTCWKSSPNFRLVGKILKQQFRHAVLVDQSNLGNGISIVPTKEAKRRRQSKSATNRNRRPSFTDFKNNEANFWQQKQQQPLRQRQQKMQPNHHQHQMHQENKIQKKQQQQPTNKKRSRINDSLFFFQKSPNFCEKDSNSDIPGTHGRRCNQWSFGSDSCTSLCCGRGYYLVKEVTKQRCQCRFHWCCDVECQTCEQIEWISICN